MNASTLAEYVARVVDTAPPLTDEQRETITRLLRPGARAIKAGGGR